MTADFLSDLIITDVVSVSTLYSNEGIWRERTHRPRWAIVVKYEGETTYETSGKKLKSNINSIAVLPKGCSYFWHCVSAGHYVAIEFEGQLEHSEALTFSVANGQKILQAVRKLETELRLKKQFSRLESIKEVYNILLMILQSEEKKYSPVGKQEKITPALEYIAQNYDKRISNDSLALRCGISTVYFRKLFSEIMRQSPIEYVQNMRMERAKEMLLSDYGSIGDVAIALGYQNICDFSRAFKKTVGVSPKAFKGTLN